MNTSHSNERGFGHIVLVIGVVLIGVIGIVAWRVTTSKSNNVNTGSSQSSSKTASAKEPDVELQNFGLASFDDIIVSMDGVRDFTKSGHKGLYVFGDKLPGGNRQNPNFEYASVKQGAKIISAIDGVVGFIKEQPESGDSEVFIQPKDNSIWQIGYDHVINLKVTKGSRVKAGDVLGEPAKQNNGLYRFEFQVNKEEGNSSVHICPTSLLATTLKDKWTSELLALQNKWESVTGMELYNPAVQDPVGCIKKTLTPEEAQGM